MHSVLALFRKRVSLLKALRWLSPNALTMVAFNAAGELREGAAMEEEGGDCSSP
jgi:hypothetical protein